MEPIVKVCVACGKCLEKMDKCSICKQKFKIKTYYW